MRCLFFIIVGFYSFQLLACDEWRDKETGLIYRSGDPEECNYYLNGEKPSTGKSKVKNGDHSKKEVLKLSEYVRQRQLYLNKPFKVEGKISFLPSPCPKCVVTPTAACKPCFDKYFIFESADKKIKILVNLKPNSKLLKNLKNGQKVILSLIKYKSAVSSPYSSYFMLENDKIH